MASVRSESDLLRTTTERTARVTGSAFFQTAVAVLADALQVHTVTISRPVPGQPGWHHLVSGVGDGLPMSKCHFRVERYAPEPAPDGRLLISPSDFEVVFDRERSPVTSELPWSAAIDVIDSGGALIGQLGVGHTSPPALGPAELDTLRLLAARTAGELERERSDAALNAANDLRERVVATGPFGVVYLNLLTSEGWSNDFAFDILGSSFDITSPAEHARFFHPDDRAEFDRAQQRLISLGEPIDQNLRVVHENGQTRWVQLHAAAGFGVDGQPCEITAVLIDRTKERTASTALASQRAELMGSLDAFADIHFQVSADGTYLAIRSRTADRAAVGWESTVGTNVNDRYPPQVARRIRAAITRTLAGEKVPPLRFAVPHHHDGPSYYEARFAPLSADRVMMVKRDATDIRALEQRLAHAAAMQSIGRLVGGIAHDFNNVLHVIRGHAGALERRAEDPRSTRRRVEAITSAVDRTSALVDRLLQLSRPPEENAAASPVDVFLDYLAFGLNPILNDDVSLKLELDAPNLVVAIDDSQFENVILNLVANAADAIEHGGTITISTRAQDKSNVVVEVADNGHGMDAATKARIFEPLFTTKAPGVGTGLGLATSYSAIIESGGAMSVRSEPNVGTTFVIVLPITDAEKAQGSIPAVQLESSPHAVILVVDDNEDIAGLCSGVLRDGGYAVIEVHDSPAALDILDGGQHVDLMLTDVTMPAMSGTELARKARLQRPDLPVIFMSGFTSDRDSAAIHTRLEQLLRKPFSDHALLDAVRSALTAHRVG